MSRVRLKSFLEKLDRELMGSSKAYITEDLGIELGFVRDDKTDTHTIYAQSRVDNQQGGMRSEGEKAKFRKQLKKAIERLENSTPIKGLKGSDSIEELKVKQATYLVMEKFKKKKNIKTSKTVKPKLTKRKGVITPKKKKSKKKGVAGTPLQLIGLINKELPRTVQENMGVPRLVNRTGRFARSVRVTDIVQTPQGFPSIGYTYDREPYGVFEDGGGAAPWANGHRDPRKLINRSIREIAAQFAIGRFYTRRQ